MTDHFDITVVPSTNLRCYWNQIKPGLEEMVERYPQIKWIPEDIYASLWNRVSELMVATRGERFLGFVVGTVQPIGSTEEKEYFIWALWGIAPSERQEEDTGLEYKPKTMAFLKAHAKSLGCKRLKCLTPHRSFEKLGFELDMYQYVCDV